MANSYDYRYRVEGGEWVTFHSWSPRGIAAGLIAEEAAQDYWNRHQPPEANMWPLTFELDGRGEYEIELRSAPVFVARRKMRALSGGLA